MPLQQSGNVTPGHASIWTTDGVVQDGGSLVGSLRVLGSLRSANFNSVSDQPIVIQPEVSAFALTNIIITNATLSFTAAVGGFYPAPSKAGTPIVSAAQTYAALTTADALMQATIASFGTTTRFSANTLTLIADQLAIYFSLSVPQPGTALADVYLIGVDLT